MRTRWGVGLYVFLSFAAPAGAQEPPREETTIVSTAPRWSAGGRLDLHYAHRAASIEETRATLNGSPEDLSSTAFISGDVSLFLDLGWENLRAVFELERLPYRDGENLLFGNTAVVPVLDQAWLEARDVLLKGLTLRGGQFDFAYKLRPYMEPFFFDSKAEPFFSGATPTFVRTTAERDLTASAGLRAQYDVAEIALAEFALVWRDQEIPMPPSAEESMAILYLNALAGERTAVFALGALAAGPGSDAEVWTIGAGADQYFGSERMVEAFAEAYFQFGRIGPRVSKRAWAMQAGGRVVLPCGLWGEAAFVYRSGDRDPADGRDQTFQSAERVDRFLIVESAEFGLDWDTNVRSLQVGVGRPLGAGLSARLDAGWFAFNGDLVDSAGALLAGKAQSRIGIEVDGGVAYELDERVRLSLRGGALRRSEVLGALSADGAQHAWVVVMGVDLGF